VLIGSLCSGSGSLDLAVQAVLGGAIAWHAETDPDACKVLEHRFPSVPNLGDITVVDWAAVPPVHVIVAGYPCQPFSLAGRKKGSADERHLWPYVAGAIRALRPQHIVLENVPNHLRLGFDTVLGDLSALGFDAEWSVLAASEIGGAHRRRRLFIYAWPAVADPDRQGLAVGEEQSHWDEFPAVERGGSHDVAADTSGVAEREPADAAHAEPGGGQTRVEPGGGSLPSRERERERERRRETVADAENDGCERSGTARGRRDGLADGNQFADWGPYEAAVRRWERVIDRAAPDPTELGPTGLRLAPRFVEWLMGLPDGWVTAVPGISRAAQIHILGNGVVPLQGEMTLRAILHRIDSVV
jgi:DNA (cytosine-5)-methyltransferase 1